MTRFWLVVALLAGLTAGLHAQALPDATEPNPTAQGAAAIQSAPGSNPSRPAFTLDIQAPDDVKQLLTQHLELQRYRTLTDLNDDELGRLIEQAQLDAQKLLATLGYFSPTLVVERAPSSGSAGEPVVKIEVHPGKATQVAQVKIDFTGAMATDQAATTQREHILSSWSLPVGSRFTQTAWDNAKQQALRLLTTQRYPTGRISATLADIDPDTALAQLTITLDSGTAYHNGEVLITGLARYDEDLVRRLARIAPGAVYDQAELVAAQQRLSDSGYFDSVFVSLDTSSTVDPAPVLVKLREARLQKVIFGVGASTDSGPRLSVEHTHYKLPGIDWRAVSKLQLERDTRSIQTELTSPPDHNNWRWAVSGLVQNELLGSLDVTSQRLRGGRSQSGERIDRNLYVQYDRAASVGTDASEPVIAQSVTANYAFTVRYYDSLPFPSKGWGWGAELGGGTTLGGEPQAYSRLLTRWQGFVQVGQDSVDTQASASRLSLRASAGAVMAKDSITLPSTQLFLAGGDNSVRGYGLHDIGVTLADGTTTAGRYLATGSIEWQRPIRINGQLSDWENTLFIDAGAVANQPSELTPKVGVGFGARWKSPVGPLQIDLAYGVDVKRLRLHMNLGFSF